MLQMASGTEFISCRTWLCQKRSIWNPWRSNAVVSAASLRSLCREPSTSTLNSAPWK